MPYENLPRLLQGDPDARTAFRALPPSLRRELRCRGPFLHSLEDLERAAVLLARARAWPRNP